MRKRERGSALIIATIVVLIIAVIGVGMVRFTQREVAGALAGQRADAVAACAAAAKQLLEAKFHVLGTQPTDLTVLNIKLDGVDGQQVALGGHIGGDPSLPVSTVKQVEVLPAAAQVKIDQMSDETSWNSAKGREGGTGYKVIVHCQLGDLSSPTTGRQLEIEYGVNFGL